MVDDVSLEKLERIMGRFAPPDFGPLDWCDWPPYTLNDLVNLPHLARMTLEWGCGAREMGRPDKTRWSVGFHYAETDMALAWQKFGPRLYVREGEASIEGAYPSVVAEMLRSLVSAIRVVEKEVLPGLADEQVRAGLCTMPNDHHRIQRMYRYFRSAAEEAAPRVAEEASGQSITEVFNRMAASSSASREVAYNRFAAVTAYFSWLEHVLTLLLPFSDFDPHRDSIPGFMSKKWGDKWNRIYPRSDPMSMRLFNELKTLAEDERNHYAHGGLGRGEDLWFHVPHFGSMPMTLTEFEDRPTFRYFEPDVENAKAESRAVWETLDMVDEWMRTGERRLAFEFIESGLDVQFDPEFRFEFNQASRDDRSFTDWVNALSEASDRMSNFE